MVLLFGNYSTDTATPNYLHIFGTQDFGYLYLYKKKVLKKLILISSKEKIQVSNLDILVRVSSLVRIRNGAKEQVSLC